MGINDLFILLPIVTKNNKGEETKSTLRINAAFITSYYEATHIHDNGAETTITYVSEIGKPDIWGLPMSIGEFEERLIPYIPTITRFQESERDGIEFKEVPIRFKDERQSQLLNKPIWIDEFCKFNFKYMTYYHQMKKVYNEEDGEIDVIYFSVGGGGFYTMLSLEEFYNVLNDKQFYNSNSK